MGSFSQKSIIAYLNWCWGPVCICLFLGKFGRLTGLMWLNLDSCLNISIKLYCFYMHSWRFWYQIAISFKTKRQRCQEYWSFGKTGSKNMQLVFQYCCKTPNGKAIFYHLRSNLLTTSVTHRTEGLMRVVKRTTSMFNSFGSNVAKQVACFFMPVFPHLKAPAA